MAGRRLLDVARIVQGTTSVVKQHAALRSEQWELYSRTSSLARATKQQTDRVTLTVQAATALAKRLGEDVQQQAGQAVTGNWRAESEATQKSQEATHSHVDTTQSTANTDKATTAAEVEREEAQPRRQEATTAPEFEPLHATQDSRGSSDIAATGINADTYPVPTSEGAEVPEPKAQDDDVPPGVNIDVFRTRRGSRILGGRPEERPSPQSAVSHIARPASINAQIAKKAAKVTSSPPSSATHGNTALSNNHTERQAKEAKEQLQHPEDAELAETLRAATENVGNTEVTKPAYQLRESRVPSTRIGRLWQYGSLATSMAFGAVGESVSRLAGGGGAGSLLLSAGNLERLVARLSRMRGAALKLGQMMSLQDVKMLPEPVHEVLRRVQDSADYMPASQRDQVLARNLGNDWRDLFGRFDEVPMAAASIGQVHRATMKSNGVDVAVKIQYPGVATSIDSDLSNLSLLLTASKLLPPGLFLDKTIANARTELVWECDFLREASCATRFHDLLADDTDVFTVPAIIPEASGETVLTAELMHGIAVTKLPHLNQDQRDWIGTNIMRLCLREITEFRFMQTDPNWTNFLYNEKTHKLELLDFGASRDYPPEFVEPYVEVLRAASHGDRDTVQHLSVQLGYLTGNESARMASAHVDSVLTLAEPFTDASPEVYDFRDQTITDRVREHIPLMLRERQAPPPEETYSLHRKLSGAFLLCAKLGSKVPARKLFSDAVAKFDAAR